MKFKVGDIAYLIESYRFIREGRIIQCSGGLCFFKFIEGGAIRVHEHRLYPAEEEAQAVIDSHNKNQKSFYEI